MTLLVRRSKAFVWKAVLFEGMARRRIVVMPGRRFADVEQRTGTARPRVAVVRRTIVVDKRNAIVAASSRTEVLLTVLVLAGL